jgi:hypothetical protein
LELAKWDNSFAKLHLRKFTENRNCHRLYHEARHAKTPVTTTVLPRNSGSRIEQRISNLVFHPLGQIVASTEREHSRTQKTISDADNVNLMSMTRVGQNGNDGKVIHLRTDQGFWKLVTERAAKKREHWGSHVESMRD